MAAVFEVAIDVPIFAAARALARSRGVKPFRIAILTKKQKISCFRSRRSRAQIRLIERKNVNRTQKRNRRNDFNIEARGEQ